MAARYTLSVENVLEERQNGLNRACERIVAVFRTP